MQMYRLIFWICFIFFLLIRTVKADVCVPIIFNEKNMPLVSFNINGKEINKISIDTGASSAFYFPKNIFNLIIPELNQHKKIIQNSIDVFGNESSTAISKENDVIVNGIMLQGIDVEILKPWGNGMLDQNGKLIINGVLGMGVIKNNKVLIIDYVSNFLMIKNNINNIPSEYNWRELKYTKTKQGIMIDVISENNDNYKMVIDTGASQSVLFTKSARGCVNISTSCPKEMITTPDSTKIHALIFQVNDKRINFDGLLGHDYLVNKVIVIINDKLLIGFPKSNN